MIISVIKQLRPLSPWGSEGRGRFGPSNSSHHRDAGTADVRFQRGTEDAYHLPVRSKRFEPEPLSELNFATGPRLESDQPVHEFRAQGLRSVEHLQHISCRLQATVSDAHRPVISHAHAWAKSLSVRARVPRERRTAGQALFRQ